MDDATLQRRLKEVAYLEGDFTLRSGRKATHYFDKYRFETQPELLREVGDRLAAHVREHCADAARLAGPELGAVPLLAAASLSSGLPFVIVRGEAKAHGTANRLEGIWQEGETVCLLEDVVTSGGAAISSVKALRDAGLRCDTAVCVLDREEGGVDELARHAVRLRALFRAADVLSA